MLNYVILGIVQGLTEFLPVSSSGHLVILQKVFGMSSDQVAISIFMHLGTLLALVIFFFKDILWLLRHPKSLWPIFVVTFITGIIGVAGKGFFEELFSSAKFVSFAWIVTGVILIMAKKFSRSKRHKVNLADAVILGAAQGLAIVPGLSRSGVTISTLLFRGINKETSFHFSFLASIPAIAGAALVKAKDIDFALKGDPKNLLIGGFFSLVFGLIALKILRLIIYKDKLHYFGYYCIFAAIITLLFIR